jgi:hypothetical protein
VARSCEIKVAHVVCIELFYNGLYLPIYTIALRIRITLGHKCPDSIGLQNLLLPELQLKVA